MCGRFARSTPAPRIAERFNARQGTIDLPPAYNISPTQKIITVRYDASGTRELAVLYWWLIPSWSGGPKAWKYTTFNARCEEVADKPTFKAALRARRCIIPMDGWYEWTKAEDGGKQPYYMHLADNELIGAAGLWETWVNKETGEVLESCSMIVGAANELTGQKHDRMPCILQPDEYAIWLNPALNDPAQLVPLLRPCPPEQTRMYAVARDVNSGRAEGPHLNQPQRL